MDPADFALRYQLLVEEIRRRMSAAATWATLPDLLDELDSLRRQVREVTPASTTGG